MSTKIHNGYRLPSMSLVSLDLWVSQFRWRVLSEVVNMARAAVVDMAVRQVDRLCLGLPTEGRKWRSPLFGAALEIGRRHREAQKTDRRDTVFDFECALQIIPIRGKILVLLYTEKDKLRKVTEQMRGLQPYPYYNNTDRPSEISAREWKKRGKDWGALTEIPLRHGFTVRCVGDHLPLRYANIAEKEIEEVHVRAARFARMQVFNRCLSKILRKDKDIPAVDLSSTVRGISEANGFLESMQGAELVRKASVRMSGKMLPPGEMLEAIKMLPERKWKK